MMLSKPQGIHIQNDLWVPAAFQHNWAEFPATLDPGHVEIGVYSDSIEVFWENDLGYLPRFEPSPGYEGRFGRLIFVGWNHAVWTGGHGEHLRDGEERGTTIHAWADEGFNLAATLSRKAREERGYYDGSVLDQFAVAIVTHDQNDRRERTPFYWYGKQPEPYTDLAVPYVPELPPEPPLPPPFEPKPCAQVVREFAGELSVLETQFRTKLLNPIKQDPFGAFFESTRHIRKGEELSSKYQAIIKRMQAYGNADAD